MLLREVRILRLVADAVAVVVDVLMFGRQLLGAGVVLGDLLRYDHVQVEQGQFAVLVHVVVVDLQPVREELRGHMGERRLVGSASASVAVMTTRPGRESGARKKPLSEVVITKTCSRQATPSKSFPNSAALMSGPGRFYHV